MTTTKASSAAAGAADETDETDDAAELKRLRAENARLKRKHEPEPAAEAEPAPLTHVLALACGHTVLSPNPHPSHHFCDEHGATLPVTGVWDRPADDETDAA